MARSAQELRLANRRARAQTQSDHAHELVDALDPHHELGLEGLHVLAALAEAGLELAHVRRGHLPEWYGDPVTDAYDALLELKARGAIASG